MTHRLAVVVCVIAGCAGKHPLSQSTVDHIPSASITPDSLTVANMNIMQQRIELYVHENNKAPSSFEQLPAIPNKKSSNVDGWGRQIRFVVNGEVITLTSLGADGKLGGTGENRDFVSAIRIADGTAEWMMPPRLN